MSLKNFVSLSKKAFFILKQRGFGVFLNYFGKYLLFGRDYFRFRAFSQEDYLRFIKRNEKTDGETIKQKIKKFKFKPLVSVITPVYNVKSQHLDECIGSVLDQTYPNFELCLWDDSSTSKETLDCLKKWQEKEDKRIKIGFGEKNQHISKASNEALKMSSGEFVVLLDNDDKLAPNALFECVALLNENPKLDFIYSDEDKLDESGKRTEPFFKPDFSPDLFLSMFYTSHLGFYRRKIIDKIFGFRVGFEGSQDYDLVLRFLEETKPEKIAHISKVLYHWRKSESSTAGELGQKAYAKEASLLALRDHLKRQEIEGEVSEGFSPGRFRIKRTIKKEEDVAIIIPFRDKSAILKRCLQSIFKKTTYKKYKIYLINNDSREAETREYLKSLSQNVKIEILNFPGEFNFSAINNFAVKNIKENLLLFLNNDTEVLNPDWLSEMVSHIERAEVGAVGAKLLFPGNTIQHAGIVLGINGTFGHAFKHLPEESEGYMSQLVVTRNCSAVTGACLLTKKDLFWEVGGFDEKNLKIAFNDVDYCLKIREKGFLIVYTPFATLYHHESLSRIDRENQQEKDFMRKKWGKLIENDPYYNPNLTRKREDFGLAD